MENPIYKMLIETVQTRRVSDFHIHAGRPVSIRESGEIVQLDLVTPHDMIGDLMRQELGDEAFEAFDKSGDVDFAIQFLSLIHI